MRLPEIAGPSWPRFRTLEEFERAAEDLPAEPGLLLRIGVEYLRQQRIPEAALHLERGIVALVSAGETSRASVGIERLLEVEHGDPELDRRLGTVAVNAGIVELGSRLLTRAAWGFWSRDQRTRSRWLLKELEEQRYSLSPTAIAGIAETRARVGDVDRAVELLVGAADSLLTNGEWAAAADLCRRAAEIGNLLGWAHRTWGVALLGLDDAVGARQRLRRWLEGEPDDTHAQIWYAEALWSLGEVDDARQTLATISEQLSIPLDEGLSSGSLRNAILEELAGGASQLAKTRLVPFWEVEDLVGRAIEERVAQEDGSERPELYDAEQIHPRPRVFLAEDTHVFRLRLSRVLRNANIDVMTAPVGTTIGSALERLVPRPDLLILPIAGNDPAGIEAIRDLRSHRAAKDVPILGFMTLDRSAVDLEALRSAGVDGLIDKGWPPEHIVFRVNQIVRRAPEGRAHERAPAFFPVDVEVEGSIFTGYALDLSVGGMRITSKLPLDPNTDVQVRFRLPDQGDDLLEIAGRVVHLRPRECAAEPYELGLFFYPPALGMPPAIQREVQRLLSLCGKTN